MAKPGNAAGVPLWAKPRRGRAFARFVSIDQTFLHQNLFSFAGDSDRDDVDVSILEPILNYSLPNKWSVGTSEMNITYDWQLNDWSALPLGVKLAKLHRFGKLPVRFSGSYE